MNLPPKVLEAAAKAAHRRAFERARKGSRLYRESDWTDTADEATRQHFRDVVVPPLEAALEQLRDELEGPDAQSAAAREIARPVEPSSYHHGLAKAALRAATNHVLGEREGGGDG
jgi:hypothetical protein